MKSNRMLIQDGKTAKAYDSTSYAYLTDILMRIMLHNEISETPSKSIKVTFELDVETPEQT